MKIVEQDGRMYIEEDGVLKPVSLEEAINKLLKELEVYTQHGEGD